MTMIHTGRRIGKEGEIRFGCSAVIYDETGTKILLTKRTDDGKWCLPGGGMEPGETVVESCVREIQEETGLEVRVKHIIGIYSNPDWLIEYPDGKKYQAVAVSLEAEVVGGQLHPTSETATLGYFTPDEIATLDVFETDKERIADALAHEPTPFLR